jgi:membrane protease YdiL (CAAX protease family)
MEISQDVHSTTSDRRLVAPLWHTSVLIVVILALSYMQARQQLGPAPVQLNSRLPLYIATILFELSLFLYVWLFGLRLTRTPVRALIGGRWSSFTDVAIDIGVAIVFWLFVAAVLLVFGKVLGENTTGLRAMKPLLPQGPLEMGVWVILCVTAGFCEEVVFRGYFQRQFLALTGSINTAIILQAVVFGMGHMYEGWKGVITIMVYGALFGILASMRRSLRPGMIQHAGQDLFSGLVGAVLEKRHMF